MVSICIFRTEKSLWLSEISEFYTVLPRQTISYLFHGNNTHRLILSIKPLENTLTEDSYISSADGWLIKNKITTEDQQDAINKGQEEMENAVIENQALFRQAEERAKKLIENYINNLGEAVGKGYTIEWKT